MQIAKVYAREIFEITSVKVFYREFSNFVIRDVNVREGLCH